MKTATGTARQVQIAALRAGKERPYISAPPMSTEMQRHNLTKPSQNMSHLDFCQANIPSRESKAMANVVTASSRILGNTYP